MSKIRCAKLTILIHKINILYTKMRCTVCCIIRYVKVVLVYKSTNTKRESFTLYVDFNPFAFRIGWHGSWLVRIIFIKDSHQVGVVPECLTKVLRVLKLCKKMLRKIYIDYSHNIWITLIFKSKFLKKWWLSFSNRNLSFDKYNLENIP